MNSIFLIVQYNIHFASSQKHMTVDWLEGSVVILV